MSLSSKLLKENESVVFVFKIKGTVKEYLKLKEIIRENLGNARLLFDAATKQRVFIIIVPSLWHIRQVIRFLEDIDVNYAISREKLHIRSHKTVFDRKNSRFTIEFNVDPGFFSIPLNQVEEQVYTYIENNGLLGGNNAA